MAMEGSDTLLKADLRREADEKRLEEAISKVRGIETNGGAIGLAFSSIAVPKLVAVGNGDRAEQKHDFFWGASHIPVDGKILGTLVDEAHKLGKVRDPNVVKFPVRDDGALVTRELRRGEDGKFANVVLPTIAKWNQPIITQASYKTLMSDSARQFLADPKNIELLHNLARTMVDGKLVRTVVHGKDALIKRGADGPYVSFVDNEKLVARMREDQRVAPYIAKAVLLLDKNYSEKVRMAVQTQKKDVGLER